MENKVLVYRVEDKDGDGPYLCHHKNKPSLISEFGSGVHSGCKKHPNPRVDGEIIRTDKDFCGFATFEKIFDWFEDDKIEWFETNGFFVAVYEVCESVVQYGNIQLVFRKDGAILVDTLVF